METTEKIVEAYARHVNGWATFPNIKCAGQYEIDLLSIDLETLDRYHIESGISISAGFSKLTNEPFSGEKLKQRTETAKQRRTLGYFRDRKFSADEVVKELAKYGFEPGNYKKVIVSWGWTEDAKNAAENDDIELWDFRVIVREIARVCQSRKTYFTDDTMRTLQLLAKSLLEIDGFRIAD